MKQEKHLVGITFDHRDDQVTLYLQANYDSRFARDLATAMYYGQQNTSDPDHFRAKVIENLMDSWTNQNVRLTAVQPHSDHTIHIVDVNNAQVTLIDDETGDTLVTYGFIQFLNRYDFAV